MKMQAGAQKWRDLATSVTALLNDLDPYGLEPGTAEGAPQDEYELEVNPLVDLLLKEGSVSSDEVDAIWLKWFQEPLSEVIGSEEMNRFCASLNSLNTSA
ncbi:hypothetical protein [Arthrobacter sp. N1]|uniref:hypothetical protein n=1 Tax=Arthrobacter sp. N1 TaxID=619291 RepID=UPI003BB0BB54